MNARGEMLSFFLKTLKKVLRDENPDKDPMASRVSSLDLPFFMRLFA